MDHIATENMLCGLHVHNLALVGITGGEYFAKKGVALMVRHGRSVSIYLLCLGECDEICYKDPVLKDRQWSAYIDRSPGAASYSEYEIPSEKVDQVHPNRPTKPPPEKKPPPPPTVKASPPSESSTSTEDILGASA
ncbi:hypothetical protein TEA_001967 [Camellia sinensis var. sinensis]|uniref:Uncharacterized protein n=1 Tax=Camellia sinensis var. sinensis TaxID=542762 RepID=A0A4S4DU59_CAMSN|nr:hypothetical protein TEA_001967 [Camellia sinensis var. sinensis]